jgi:hypothetical protein
LKGELGELEIEKLRIGIIMVLIKQ